MISFASYLHERAEEARHNESVSLSIVVLGAVLFVGGILETAMTTSNMQWLLFLPYQLTSPPGLLGIALTVVGLALAVFGIGLAIHYSSQRAWYFDELKKTYSLQEDKLKSKKKKKSVRTKKRSK
ncbi:hypothetical protein GWO13_06900 [Candidatus Bathyarchaeota archaeon]|nr:hypothetical protein [Candidatus Bathyarchaeota archaeon]